VVALLLVFWKLGDLYAHVVAPRLAPYAHQTVEPIFKWIDAAALWIALLIVLGAIMYTHWETARLVQRDPAVTARLKRFYARLEHLLNIQVRSEEELGYLHTAVDFEMHELIEWVKQNMEPASLTRLRESTMMLPYQPPVQAFSDQHQMTLNGLNRIRCNLRAILESEVWC
jgi:hypothetical protein